MRLPNEGPIRGCQLMPCHFAILQYVQSQRGIYCWGPAFEHRWASIAPTEHTRFFQDPLVRQLIEWKMLDEVGNRASLSDIGEKLYAHYDRLVRDGKLNDYFNSREEPAPPREALVTINEDAHGDA
jgi:hypothetical protein